MGGVIRAICWLVINSLKKCLTKTFMCKSIIVPGLVREYCKREFDKL